MKVIDLLNKIANEEEVPKKIKYENNIYNYDNSCQDYKLVNVFGYTWLINKIFDDYENTSSILSYEIEIIEEDKEIEDKCKNLFELCEKMLEEDKEIEEIDIDYFNNANITAKAVLLYQKQREIIDLLKELKKGK